MSKPKKGKEGMKGAGSTGGQKWDEVLIQEQLETENWRVCVAVMSGEDHSSEEMISSLARHITTPAADSKQRRHFYSLSHQEVLKKALEAGGAGPVSKSQASKGKGKGAQSPGGGLGGKPPGAEALAELVKTQSISEEGPGPDTVARAIKMSLLLLRQEDMMRRQNEGVKDGGSRPRSGAGSPGKKGDKKGEKATPATKGKPGGKGGKPAEEGIPMPSKPESTLKRRGEEVGEAVFVDDEPVHGPDAYVLLSGVRVPEVLAEMGRVGVSPSCVVRVRGSLGAQSSEGEVDEGESERRNKIGEKLKEFWKGVKLVLETSRDSGTRDTGRIQFEYRGEDVGEGVEGLYDTLATNIYAMLEEKRHHRRYLECLSLADLSGGKASKRDKGDGVYRELLASLPSQSRSISFLMESMLQQVCVADASIPVEKDAAVSPALQESLNRIRKRANIGSPTGKTVEEKSTSYPIIYEGDKIRERESLLDHPTTSQHRGLDKRGVEKRMLDTFYTSQLVKRFPSLDPDERCRVDAHYQQLLRIARQSGHPLTPHEVQNALLRLAFAEMLDAQNSHLFDDPYPCKDRQASISRLKPILSRLQWSEVLARDVIAQRIQEVLAPDKTCLLRYHKQSDSLLLLFRSQSGSEQWERRVLTPAGFYLYQRFLHADLSPLVEELSRLNSSEREKLLIQQDLTPNPSQVSLTQLSGKEGRPSSHTKSTNRASRSSRLKDSRTSTPVSSHAPAQEGAESREDLQSAPRSEPEQKCVFLSGYDVRDDWYAGKGESEKIQLSSDEFIRCEQRAFYSSPLTSVSVQYCHSSGLSVGISLLMEKSPLHKLTPADTRDNVEAQDDDVIAPVTLREPTAGMVYGSYRVSLHSGVQVSLSPYGKLGGLSPPRDMIEDSEIRHMEEELERSTPHGIPPTTSESKVGGKGGGRGKKGEEQQVLEQQRQLTEERERRRREIERLREDSLLRYRRMNKYQSLFLSTQYGLQVNCATKVELSNDVTARDGSDGCLRVTQCYPNSPSPTQSCDRLRLVPASQEVSRSYLEDGTVIKLMKDATVQLLWPDGSCARSLLSGELEQMSRQVTELSNLTSDSHHRSLQTLSAIVNSHSSTGSEFSLGDKQWLYTDREGQRLAYRWTQETEEGGDESEERGMKDGEGEQAATPDKETVSTFTAQVYGEPLLKSWQVDPVSEEEMLTREDQLISVLRKDGTRIVQFSDGTRITSSAALPYIQIECPGYAKVRFSTPTPGQATITLFENNEVVSHRSGEHSVTCDDVTCHFTADGLLSVTPSELCQLELDLVSGGEWMRVSNSSQVYAIDKQFHTLRKREQDGAKSKDRMFVLTRDGSGMELLSKESAELELERWRGTKGLLVQSHALPGSSETIIHSAISPVTTPPHEISHLPYTEENIVPTHLRAQCYFPLNMEKCRSEVFGSGVGRGLSIGVPERGKGGTKLPPRAFWRRELLEDRPVGGETLSHLVSSLDELNICWEGIRGNREQSAPIDTRAESVRDETNSLFHQFRSLQLEGREDELVEEYKERVQTPPSKDRGHAPSERRPDKAEQEKREREEFQASMTALRNKDIPGYFESESGLKFLQQTSAVPPDMLHLTEQLPLAMRRGQPRGTEGSALVASAAPAPERLILPRLSELSQEAEGLTQGYASTTILLPDTSGSSISLTAKERPTNPSPRFQDSTEASACGSEENPTLTSAITREDLVSGPRPQNPVAMESTSDPIPEYLFYNVAGVPRVAPVKLPTSIKTLRPGDRESERIDDTKKQPNTASLSMPLSKGLKQGISLQQTELNFGLLKEGRTYSATVHIKNIGITSTRYKIKPPPPCTGLRAYYAPHPIAAGMSAPFQVEIYAVPVGVVGERGRGRVEHELEIISEVNTLSLPVTATVLTVTSYEEEVGELVLTRGVTLVPGSASSRDGFRGAKK